MRKKQQRLVWCLREQWLPALRCGMELNGDAIALDAGRYGAGIVCLPAVDSGETGYEWGRVTLECTLPQGSSVQVYAFAGDSMEAFWPGLQDAWSCVEDDYGKAQRELVRAFGPPQGGGTDLLLEQKGRYLWLAVEFLSGSAEPVSLDRVIFWMGGDRMTDYLPAIYRGDRITERFLAIFNSMMQDMEQQIGNVPALLDYENNSEEMLRYLAGWLCLDGRNADVEQLRRWVSTAMEDGRTRYTPQGIRRTVERLTGRSPILIEYAQVDPNAPECGDRDTCRRLFGEDPCRFFILLEEDTFQTREQTESFVERMQEYIPAHMEMQLVLLRKNIRLGGHSYLGINSVVSGYVPVTIDESTTIHFDTIIGG